MKMEILRSDTFPLNQYENQPDCPNKYNEWIKHSKKNDIMFHFFILILIIRKHLPNLGSISMLP